MDEPMDLTGWIVRVYHSAGNDQRTTATATEALTFLDEQEAAGLMTSTIYRCRDGQMLQVGRDYLVAAAGIERDLG